MVGGHPVLELGQHPSNPSPETVDGVLNESETRARVRISILKLPAELPIRRRPREILDCLLKVGKNGKARSFPHMLEEHGLGAVPVTWSAYGLVAVEGFLGMRKSF